MNSTLQISTARYAVAPLLRLAQDFGFIQRGEFTLFEQMLPGHPFFEGEGAGAERCMAEILTRFFYSFLGHNIGKIERHFVEEGDIRCAQGKLDRARINGFDAFHRLGFALNKRLRAFDADKETRTRATGLRVEHTADRIHDIVRREFAIIAKFGPLAQRKGVDQEPLQQQCRYSVQQPLPAVCDSEP